MVINIMNLITIIYIMYLITIIYKTSDPDAREVNPVGFSWTAEEFDSLGALVSQCATPSVLFSMTPVVLHETCFYI
jgi:hypothetical protein